jgi:hypothetical protein
VVEWENLNSNPNTAKKKKTQKTKNKPKVVRVVGNIFHIEVRTGSLKPMSEAF